jgi:uncharacterized protein (TIGR04255 family)
LEAGSNREGLPEFRKPPVFEVAAGVFFPRLKGFLLPHFGEFWSRIRPEFPIVEHAGPLASGAVLRSPAELIEPTGTILPRVWLINNSGDGLIQLQRDAFFYNWRRQSESNDYPRYPMVIAKFWDYFSKFNEFLVDFGIPKPEIGELELTYVNHIPKSDLWSDYSDISKVFRDFDWQLSPQRFLPVPFAHSQTFNFSIPDRPAILTATIQSAIRQSDQVSIIRLNMSVRHQIGSDNATGTDSVRQAFEVAHEWIVQGFADLTSHFAQERVWERLR